MKRLRLFLLLSVCAAPLATPSFAQDEADRSFRGSAPDGQADTGVVAPPGAETQLVPPIAVNPGEAQRGLSFEDPDALVRSFGTVARRSDGSVERSDAAPEVGRALRERAGRDVTANSDDDALGDIDPLFSSDRAIVGDDNRVRVDQNKTFPFRAIGLLRTRRDQGGGSCSATLIGPRTVITAAHCVYSHDKGGWADSITFYPGANGEGNFPYRGYEYDTAYILQGYLDNYKGYYGSVVPWDLAVVTLQDAAGDRVGWLGYGANNRKGFLAFNIGYPGDKPYGTMWRDKCDVVSSEMEDNEYTHRCDTWAGSSGSSMYVYKENPENRIVQGINVAEVKSDDRAKSYNIGVPLNTGYFEWVRGKRR